MSRLMSFKHLGVIEILDLNSFVPLNFAGEETMLVFLDLKLLLCSECCMLSSE